MLPRARQDKLLVTEVGEDLVVYDQRLHRAHHLNRTAAVVWQHCDGQTGIDALAALLPMELGARRSRAAVHLALEQLADAQLLQETLSATGAESSVTRRRAVRRLGLAGSLAILAPVVSSIVAPTPAMARSSALDPCLSACADAEAACSESLPARECAARRARCEARCAAKERPRR